MKTLRWIGLVALLVGGCDTTTGPDGEGPSTTWTAVREWSGSEGADLNTELFMTPRQWRIILAAGPSSTVVNGEVLGGLSIIVYNRDGQPVDFVSTDPETTDTTYLHNNAGEHYLEINPLWVGWTVTVQRAQ